MIPHLIYLHGFATSPAYSTAQVYAQRLAARGTTLHIPDLNVPDFPHLTLTAMLERIAGTVRGLPPGAVGLIGSSMGGLAAVHFLERYRTAEAARVEKLMLLAPVFDYMAARRATMSDDDLTRWRDEGALDVFHYADGTTYRLHYGLVEDIQQYASYPDITIQTLIYHGTNDEAVDPNQSIRFAEGRPNVELRLVNSDHQMLDHADTIFDALLDFFGV